MVDGLVVLLVGMGAVFCFLVLLMGLIKILSLRKARSQSHACLERASAFSAPPRASDHRASKAVSQVVDDEGPRRAAAVAVALVLASRRPPRPCVAGAEPSAWRSAGRADLMKSEARR
mgnify:CR=1 FL=1